MSERKLFVGTRASSLALWQANHVVGRLRATTPELNIHVARITTQGDRLRDRALSQIGDKGLFVKEIEDALLAGEIDLAVHSLKDVPTELPDGLAVGAILEREDPRDALVTADGRSSLATLPVGARVGTSSLRRQAQLLAVRPDLQVVDLRGNVDTRLRMLDTEKYDAIVLARAGLVRLGHAEAITESLAVDVMLPAVGQGALCIEIRAEDRNVKNVVALLDHQPTHQAALAERAFLHRLGAGCQAPIGAYASMSDTRLHLRGLVASLDGSRLVRDEISGRATEAVWLGTTLAERVLESGGHILLEEARHGN